MSDFHNAKKYPLIYAFICGRTTVPARGILRGRKGFITLPVPAFVIVHESGVVVFDSGFSSRIHTDPSNEYAPPEFYRGRWHEFFPEDELSAQMYRAGMDPDNVSFVINSHFHYDHCGGNDQFPRATVIVQEQEFRTAMAAPDEKLGYRKMDFMTQQRKILLNGCLDVFGDETVVALPTPGHTPGHQSLVVTTAGGRQVMLTADACYMQETLADTVLPEILTDEKQFRESLTEIRHFKERSGFIAYGHDPEFWSSAPLAPEPLAPVVDA